MTEKEAARQRVAGLKRLREEHSETVSRAQVLLKEQQAVRKLLREAMKNGPRTIPEIAASTALPVGQVLWHVMAMKKYDLVREVGKEGDYFAYALAKEVER